MEGIEEHISLRPREKKTKKLNLNTVITKMTIKIPKRKRTKIKKKKVKKETKVKGRKGKGRRRRHKKQKKEEKELKEKEKEENPDICINIESWHKINSMLKEPEPILKFISYQEIHDASEQTCYCLKGCCGCCITDKDFLVPLENNYYSNRSETKLTNQKSKENFVSKLFYLIGFSYLFCHIFHFIFTKYVSLSVYIITQNNIYNI